MGRIDTSAGTKQLKRFGYPSRKAAETAAQHVGKLLDLAASQTDRERIGDMLWAIKRGAPLPTVEDVQRRLGLGLDPSQPGLTVREWLDAWLATKRRTKRESTYRGYEMHIRTWLKPQLGHLPLDRLNAGHIEELFATIGRINTELTAQRAAGVAPMEVKIEGDVRGQSRECGPTTQLRIFATLRAALNAAVKQRKITWNPCDGVELEQPYRDPETGEGRTGALLGVERPIIQLGGKLRESKAKTKMGQRRVFLDHETAELLREHRKAQLRLRLKAGNVAGQRPGVLPRRRAALEAGPRVQAVQEAGRASWRPSHLPARGRPTHRQLAHAGRGRRPGAADARSRPRRQVRQRPLCAPARAGAPGRRRADSIAGAKGEGREESIVTGTDVPILFSSGNRATKSQSAGNGFTAVQVWWGGWGSNPRPADYESAALTC
jgi:Phage integrase, N-terminal SAM-like domain